VNQDAWTEAFVYFSVFGVGGAAWAWTVVRGRQKRIRLATASEQARLRSIELPEGGDVERRDEANRIARDEPGSARAGPAPAHFAARFGAAAIDGTLLAMGIFLIAQVEAEGPLTFEWVFAPGTIAYAFLWIVGGWIWAPLNPTIRGATIGKRIVGIEIVSRAVGPASAVQILHRQVMFLLLALIPVINLLNWSVVVFGSEHRGWHDRAAGTIIAWDDDASGW